MGAQGKAQKIIKEISVMNQTKRPARSVFRPADGLMPAISYPFFPPDGGGSSCCTGPWVGPTGPTGPVGSNCDQPAFTYVLDGDMVNVIDPLTHGIAATITAPFTVAAMGYDPVLHKVYLVSADGRLAVVDGITNTLEDEIMQLPAGDYTGSGITANPNTHMVYIASPNNPFVAVFNGRTNEALPEIDVAGIGSVTVNPNTNLVYIATASGMAIVNSNTNEIAGSINYEAQYGLTNLTVNVCRNLLVASDGDTLVLFDARRNIPMESAEAEDGIRAMALDSGLGYLYVINTAGDAVHVYDACSLRLLGDLDLDLLPGADLVGLSVDPRTHLLYITDIYNGATYVVDGGLNQQISTAEGTGADGVITLACPSACRTCCGGGPPGPAGATGPRGARGPAGAPGEDVEIDETTIEEYGILTERVLEPGVDYTITEEEGTIEVEREGHGAWYHLNYITMPVGEIYIGSFALDEYAPKDLNLFEDFLWHVYDYPHTEIVFIGQDIEPAAGGLPPRIVAHYEVFYDSVHSANLSVIFAPGYAATTDDHISFTWVPEQGNVMGYLIDATDVLEDFPGIPEGDILIQWGAFTDEIPIYEWTLHFNETDPRNDLTDYVVTAPFTMEMLTGEPAGEGEDGLVQLFIEKDVIRSSIVFPSAALEESSEEDAFHFWVWSAPYSASAWWEDDSTVVVQTPLMAEHESIVAMYDAFMGFFLSVAEDITVVRTGPRQSA